MLGELSLPLSHSLALPVSVFPIPLSGCPCTSITGPMICMYQVPSYYVHLYHSTALPFPVRPFSLVNDGNAS